MCLVGNILNKPEIICIKLNDFKYYNLTLTIQHKLFVGTQLNG